MPTSIARHRIAAFHRQSGRCYYCELPLCMGDAGGYCARYQLTFQQAQRLRCTAEHLDARQDGGRNAARNIVAACLHCNQTRHRQKYPLEPARYRRYVQLCLRRGRWHHPEILSALTGCDGATPKVFLRRTGRAPSH